MIRPLTCVAALLAFGSGLYLYQTKHQAQVLDRQIERTIKTITATRLQTRELAAAWTLLGNPDRLQQLSDQFLDIKQVQPSQFVAMADLDSRLPAPRPLAPTPPATPEDSDVATIPAPTAEPTAADAPTAPTPSDATPSVATPTVVAPSVAALGGATPGSAAPASAAPGSPAARAAVISSLPGPSPSPATGTAKVQAAPMAARPAERRPNEASRPARDVAQTRDTAPTRLAPTHAAPPRPTSAPPVIAELDRPATPTAQRLSAAPPIAGSLLGMAHAAVRPPAPLPISSNGN